MKINEIGRTDKVFIIAEMSANHCQDFETAKAIISAAKESGADAVKVQTFRGHTVTVDVKREEFRIKTAKLWEGKYLYDLYEQAYLPWEWHHDLFSLADELGIEIFSTVTDRTSTDFVSELDPPAYKIASFEITDIPLIRYVASKGKPVIISTGIATLGDIEDAVNACREAGNEQIILLKCASQYPAPFEEINLRSMVSLGEIFGVPVGFSDHTEGFLAPVIAVSLGARVIEKHFILNRNDESFDRDFSLTPEEFAEMVEKVRDTEKILGRKSYQLTERNRKSKEFQRSLYAVRDIARGEAVTEDNVKAVRPGYGLPPKYFDEIVGMKAVKKIKKGEPLAWNLLKPSGEKKKEK
jgi:pseudaminic acid synthase